MSTLSSESVARLRHDLRTYVNHVRGYGEMILEVLEEEGPAGLQPGVRRLLGLATAILDRIQTGLPTGRDDLTNADVDRVAIELREPADEADRILIALIPDASQQGFTEIVGDLQKIHKAVADLRAFLASGLTIDAQVETAAAPVEAERPAVKSSTNAARILVVDDVEANRDMLRRRLEKEGHQVVMAGDGQQALDLIARGGLDLILLDILMPGIDGFTVLRQVKSTASGRDLPIIMISSLDEIRSVVRCIEMGAEDYLPKPFDPILLRARVGACLEKKRFRDQELAYLHNVTLVTAAAAAIEAGAFDPGQLESVAQRQDELGRLARVFQRMGKEVQAREDRLKTQVLQLRIEIDEAKKKKQVAEVVESEYFKELQEKAKLLRGRTKKI